MARATTVAALVAAVAVLPVIVLIWQAVRLGGEGGASSASYARPYEDLVRYSARWYSYLLPSAHHPILGGQVAAFQLGQGNENFVEQTNYIGYATVALALLGSWVALRGWPSAQRWRRWAISFFVLLGLVAIWLSLGPVLKLASWEIPMPSSFLFAVMPFFRAYTRWGIVAMLAASVLAGVGVAVLVGQWHQRRQQIVVLAGVFFLLGFELASGPARVVTDVSEPPSVYQWLARQHGEATVAEYPLVDATDPLTSQYLFWQRVHRRPLFNGVTLGSKGDSYRRQALDIDDPGTAPLLAALGVEYAIVHVDLYAARPAYPGGVPRLEQVSQGFALAQDFGSTLVYRVTASP